MKRYDAIKTLVECINGEYLIACNGMISRELCAIKDRNENFYMLGSMGLAASIGLGVSIAQPHKRIVVVAGDGNALMSLGTLGTIGKNSPPNLIYVVLDNECHESTGGQETSSSNMKLDSIALSCGFTSAEYADSLETLKSVFLKILKTKGPTFLHIKIDKQRVEVPRVIIAPEEIKNRFIKSFSK